jgi:hypothetical protein
MKRDQKIKELYKDFIENLTHLLEESDGYFKEKLATLEDGKYTSKLKSLNSQIENKIQSQDKAGLEKLYKTYNDIASEMEKHGRGIFLQLNSNFIYSFALFEAFQLEVIRITCKKNSTPRRKFQSKFKTEAVKAFEKGNKEYVGMLLDHNKMIENSHIIDNPMKICRDIFDINRIQEFEKYWRNYLEARERRNLLVHRGVYYDKKYEESLLVRGGVRNKKNKTAKEWLEDLTFKFQKKDSRTDKKNLSVTPRYMFHIYTTLFYMASLTYFSSFQLTKKEIKDNEEIFPGHQHSNMELIDKYPPISAVLLDIWKAYYFNKANKKWENVPDFEKMNHIVVLGYVNDRYKEQSGKEIPKFKQMVKGVLSTVTENHTSHKELVQNYIDGDVDKLIETTKKIGLDKGQIEEWFVFNKFKKDKSFQRFINSL